MPYNTTNKEEPRLAKNLLRLMKLPSLPKLLTYNNKSVVHYFCHTHPGYSEKQARQLFADLLSWMWLNLYRQESQRPTYLFGPLLILDKLWHSFILHTRDYISFCHRYFGDYFHHQVEPPGFEHELTIEELTDFLNDCFEYLGADWVSRYFETEALSGIPVKSAI